MSDVEPVITVESGVDVVAPADGVHRQGELEAQIDLIGSVATTKLECDADDASCVLPETMEVHVAAT